MRLEVITYWSELRSIVFITFSCAKKVFYSSLFSSYVMFIFPHFIHLHSMFILSFMIVPHNLKLLNPHFMHKLGICRSIVELNITILSHIRSENI